MADANNALQEVFAAMSLCGSGNSLRLAGSLGCRQPAIGNLIATVGYRFLVETLSLRAELFNKEYPASNLTASERRVLKETITNHQRSCPRCQAEADAQERWDQEFQQFLATQKGGAKNNVGGVKPNRSKPKAMAALAPKT